MPRKALGIVTKPELSSNKELEKDFNTEIFRRVEKEDGSIEPRIILFRPQGRPKEEFESMIAPLMREGKGLLDDPIIVSISKTKERSDAYLAETGFSFKLTVKLVLIDEKLVVSRNEETFKKLTNILINSYGFKIDPSLILVMRDEELSRYIPTYGDRLAAVVWSKAKDSEHKDDKSKSSSLLERLRQKMSNRRKRGQREHDLHVGNKNEKKSNRRIEVGWMDFDKKANAFKQVRSQNGGGTRHLIVERDSSQEEIMLVAKKLFFPNGENKKGKENMFTFSIKEFRGEELGQKTVASLYEETKVKILRLYMYTMKSTEDNFNTESCVSSETTAIDSTGTPAAAGTPNAATGTPVSSTSTPTATTRVPVPFTSTPAAASRTPYPSTQMPTSAAGTPLLSSPTADTGTHNAAVDSPFSFLGTPNVVLNTCSAPHRTPTALTEMPTTSTGTPTTVLFAIVSETLHETLTKLASLIKADGKNIVNVTRREVMPGAIRCFNRPSFNPQHGLSVKFAGEQAIDDGGQSREFLRLLMKEISSLPIFTGDDANKILDLNYSALQSNLYSTAGKMIAYCVVHNGPLPRFFSPLLFSTIVCDNQVQPTIDDIKDVGHRQSILKIRNAEDMTSFLDAVAGADQLIQLAGCYPLTHNFEKREELSSALIHFIVLARTRECHDQFSQGLATLGVLGEMRLHSNKMKELFCFDDKYELDASSLEILFGVQSFSEPGSNRLMMEEVAVTHWNDYLLDVAEGTESVSLKDVLVFATGAESIPPLGLHPQPQLTFHTAREDSPEERENFPHANTCANILDIPMISDYDMFKRNMNAAICNNNSLLSEKTTSVHEPVKPPKQTPGYTEDEEERHQLETSSGKLNRMEKKDTLYEVLEKMYTNITIMKEMLDQLRNRIPKESFSSGKVEDNQQTDRNTKGSFQHEDSAEQRPRDKVHKPVMPPKQTTGLAEDEEGRLQSQTSSEEKLDRKEKKDTPYKVDKKMDTIITIMKKMLDLLRNLKPKENTGSFSSEKVKENQQTDHNTKGSFPHEDSAAQGPRDKVHEPVMPPKQTTGLAEDEEGRLQSQTSSEEKLDRKEKKDTPYEVDKKMDTIITIMKEMLDLLRNLIPKENTGSFSSEKVKENQQTDANTKGSFPHEDSAAQGPRDKVHEPVMPPKQTTGPAEDEEGRLQSQTSSEEKLDRKEKKDTPYEVDEKMNTIITTMKEMLDLLRNLIPKENTGSFSSEKENQQTDHNTKGSFPHEDSAAQGPRDKVHEPVMPPKQTTGLAEDEEGRLQSQTSSEEKLDRKEKKDTPYEVDKKMDTIITIMKEMLDLLRNLIPKENTGSFSSEKVKENQQTDHNTKGSFPHEDSAAQGPRDKVPSTKPSSQVDENNRANGTPGRGQIDPARSVLKKLKDCNVL